MASGKFQRLFSSPPLPISFISLNCTIALCQIKWSFSISSSSELMISCAWGTVWHVRAPVLDNLKWNFSGYFASDFLHDLPSSTNHSGWHVFEGEMKCWQFDGMGAFTRQRVSPKGPLLWCAICLTEERTVFVVDWNEMLLRWLSHYSCLIRSFQVENGRLCGSLKFQA